MGKHV